MYPTNWLPAPRAKHHNGRAEFLAPSSPPVPLSLREGGEAFPRVEDAKARGYISLAIALAADCERL
jgi:hypothetical protein